MLFYYIPPPVVPPPEKLVMRFFNFLGKKKDFFKMQKYQDFLKRRFFRILEEDIIYFKLL